MSNHTPGPWVISRKLDDHYEIESTAISNEGARTNGQNWIGTVWVPKTSEPKYGMGHMHRGIADYQQADCNASLIAAAPELLEACQAMSDGWGNGNDEESAILLIRAAIAKATGADHA